MKLALLCFDDVVPIPGGKVLGSDMLGDACESTYRAVDGWDLDEVRPGVFTLRAEHMAVPLTVGGYGYRYVAMPAVVEPSGVAAGAYADQAAVNASAKGKRR